MCFIIYQLTYSIFLAVIYASLMMLLDAIRLVLKRIKLIKSKNIVCFLRHNLQSVFLEREA